MVLALTDPMVLALTDPMVLALTDPMVLALTDPMVLALTDPMVLALTDPMVLALTDPMVLALRPYGPGTDRPYGPGTDEPYGPGTDEPYGPGTDRPTGPGSDEPYGPGTDRPEGPVHTPVYDGDDFPTDVTGGTFDGIITPGPFINFPTVTEVPTTTVVADRFDDDGTLPPGITGVTAGLPFGDDDGGSFFGGVGGTTGSPVGTVVSSTENDTSMSLHIPLVTFIPALIMPFLVTKLPPGSAGSPTCKDNYNCKDTQLCYGGVCVDGCSVSKCGYKAQCHTVHHIPMCTCVPGHRGNPLTECLPKTAFPPPPSTCHTPPPTPTPRPPSVPPSAQCVRDSDCSFAESCRGGSCVDPCAVGAPCGLNAVCAVTLHRPICSCPAGYTGNPRQECLKGTPSSYL
ncbi:hypothetical protein C7M84_020735 [Penaeus vannamei]|uniref:EGF-like domain-containing protein n=1 Tax=Penaeus vannamei TaxID=6689 RepID=A0A3R7QA72_PENVA|nr:hypothetical protein C7M84_020735 [Penaeus vannamei]